MGQWATRGRRGGQKTPPRTVPQIVRAVKTASQQVRFTYDQNGRTDLLEAEDFHDDDTSAQGQGIPVVKPSYVVVDFDDIVEEGDDITYNGNPTFFLSPQTIEVTI